MRYLILILILCWALIFWGMKLAGAYEVRGKTYQVLPTATGFKEQGIASWYGGKFHGRKTANGEVYDMHQLTAAHKTLPLPTYVLVKNIDNGFAVIVRVNDRGPFIDDRIIDLSYAAAKELRMVDAGIGEVQIEALFSPLIGAK